MPDCKKRVCRIVKNADGRIVKNANVRIVKMRMPSLRKKPMPGFASSWCSRGSNVEESRRPCVGGVTTENH